MAIGKPLNRGFHSESESMNSKKEIAMPPLPEEVAHDQAESNNHNKDFMGVPESVPNQVYENMDDTADQDVQVEPVQAESEQVELEENSEADRSQDKKLDDKRVTSQDKSSQKAVSEKPTPQDSFKSIREAKEKAERERDMLMKQMMEYQKAMDSKSKASEPVPLDDNIDFDMQEDDLVEGRYVKKVANKIKNLEKQLQSYENNYKQQTIETKIKNDFPDFDKVVSEENVYLLNQQFPEIARALGDTQDLYNKAASAYNVIKKFGIHREDPHQEDRIKALANTQKPRTLTSVNPQQGDSPLSKANAFANGLTEELKAQLRKEMIAARRV